MTSSAAEPRRRLDQLLSSLGYCSRKQARDFLRSGRVFVAGVTAPKCDERVVASQVQVDDAPLEAPNGLLALFHKPLGCVCTHSADEGPTIYEWLPERWCARTPAVTSVGRLDKDTSGLLLITDQGGIVQRLTSPRAEVSKVYHAEVHADIPANLVEVFASGTIMLRGEEKPCLPAELEITGPRSATLTLTEGRYHQVRRMFASLGLTVVSLHRSKFGSYDLGDLKPGEWRLVNP